MGFDLGVWLNGEFVISDLYLSYNHSNEEAAKYWYVRNHWYGKKLGEAKKHLQTAITNLANDGIKAVLGKDVWQSDLSTFAYVLQDIYDAVKHIDDNADCVLDGDFGTPTTNNTLSSEQPSATTSSSTESKQAHEQSKQENKQESKQEDGSDGDGDIQIEIGIRCKLGMITMKSQRDAEVLYFRLLRSGESETDPVVKKIKAIALEWGTLQNY